MKTTDHESEKDMSQLPEVDQQGEMQTIDFRLRVRTTVPAGWSAKEVLGPIMEAIEELQGVVGVKEHSWDRLEEVIAQQQAATA